MKPLIGGEYVHPATAGRVEVLDYELRNGARTGAVVVRTHDRGAPPFLVLPTELRDETGRPLEPVPGAAAVQEPPERGGRHRPRRVEAAADPAAAGAPWKGTITEAIRKAEQLPGVTAFVSADWERQGRVRLETGDDLVRCIARVRELIAPEAAERRVYTVTPEGRIHNTVTGRDEYVAISPDVVKERPGLERAIEQAQPAAARRVRTPANDGPAVTPALY